MRVLLILLVGLGLAANAARADIVIENREMRLVLSDDARALSLLHLPTRTECLMPGTGLPAFSTRQQRGYAGDLNPRIVPASAVRRDGNRLIVSFDRLVSRAILRITITDAYIGFTLEKIEGDASFSAGKARPAFFNEETLPFDELFFLQLPVKERAHFGEWLNVAWDNQVAVNLLATDPFGRVDSVREGNGRILRAAAVGEVRQEAVGAALVVTQTAQLLDRLERVEEDFSLPHGVRARRRPDAALSYWKINDPVTLQNVDDYLRIARAGGLRSFLIYHRAFARTLGHFPWRDEYPNGMSDLRAVVDRLSGAGITCGFHLHFSKAHVDDAYVSPVPDRRLHLRQHFTLAVGLTDSGSEIEVLEDPSNCTLDDDRRLLRFGDEVIAYRTYTTRPPFRFTGCQRGALKTTPAAHVAGTIGGLLDVDNWPVYVRFDQRTTIQPEMAERLGRLYAAAGFRFAYFDGSEDVHPPYWYNVAHAQWQVYQEFKPEPLYAETSTLAHFNWHMMSRSTAEDPVTAEELKDFIAHQRLPEAAARAANFTRCDFGWIRFRPPSATTLGMQPDIIEYATSRAAGWDCPISIVATLRDFDGHPRTPDNLEIIRRWEEVRATRWLTAAQQRALQQSSPEHTLLVNEAGKFELVPCRPISVGGKSSTVRAMMFERAGKTWISFWDTRGQSRLAVSLPAVRLRLFRDLGKSLAVEKSADGVVLEASERRYLEVDGLAAGDVEAALGKARNL